MFARVGHGFWWSLLGSDSSCLAFSCLGCSSRPGFQIENDANDIILVKSKVGVEGLQMRHILQPHLPEGLSL